LIRNQTPDKEGRLLPPDLTSGTYSLRDLADPAAGGLYEGKVIIDKTHGHAAYGCMICCGEEPPPLMFYDPIGVGIQSLPRGDLRGKVREILLDASGFGPRQPWPYQSPARNLPIFHKTRPSPNRKNLAG
jgi:hypothetical protein